MALRTRWPALAVALLLAGCGGGDQAADPASTEPGTPVATAPDLSAGTSAAGLPDGVDQAPQDAVAGVARTEAADLIAVVTFGSSTCPEVPEPAASSAADAPGTVTIDFPPPDDGPCTMDYVPTTTLVALPDEARDGELTVTIGDHGTVTLPEGSAEPVWVTG